MAAGGSAHTPAIAEKSLKRLTGAKDRAGLERVLALIDEKGVIPQRKTSELLAIAHAIAGDAEKALGVLQALAGAGVVPDPVPFNYILIGVVRRRRDSGLAEECLQLMKSLGVTPSRLHHSLTIEAHVKGGAGAAAEAALQRLMSEGHQPTSREISSVMSALVRAQDGVSALAKFELALTAGRPLDHFEVLWALRACFSLRDIAKAEAVVAAVVSRGAALDTVQQTALATVYASCSEFMKARDLIWGCRTSARLRLARSLMRLAALHSTVVPTLPKIYSIKLDRVSSSSQSRRHTYSTCC